MSVLDSLGLGSSGNSGDSGLTPESIAQRRRLAEALLQQGQADTPIRHWSQGANRVLQSMLGTYRLGELDKEDRAGAKEASSQIARIFNNNTAAPASPAITPAAPMAAPPRPATQAQGAAAAAGRDYPAPAATAGGPYDAAAFIKQQEGYAPVAKWDVRQNSGGYGSKAEPGETFTPEKAEQYLQRDMQPSMAWIDTNVPNATPAQRAALASFGYNLGTDDLDKLLPDIQRGDWATVGRRMLTFNNAATGPDGALEVNSGLTARRLREAALLRGGGQQPAAGAQPAAPAVDALAPPSAASKLQQRALELMKNPRNAALGRELLIKAALLEAPKQPEDVQKYEYDMRQRAANGQELVPFSEWLKTGKLGGETFGKTPIWGVDEDGNPALVQVSDRGRGTQTTMPQNVRIGKDPIKIDAGLEWILLDPVTRQAIGRIPKDVAGEAQQKKVGEGVGERIVAQPAAMASVRSSLSGLNRLAEAAERLKGMEGLPAATGNLQGRSFMPTIRQSTKDAEAELETLKSQVAFSVLQAMRDASKTGGALGSIAVEELKMLQNNLASLDTLQGDEKFKQSLDAISAYAKGAQERLLRGYKDTYGQDFDGAAEAPTPATDQPAGGGSYKVLKVH